MRKLYKDAYTYIKKAKHIVIISHINPDADTIGSMLGLGISLKSIGKKITFINTQKSLPKKLDFLPNFKKIKTEIPDRYDLLISVDAASKDRLGFDNIKEIDISFDHHKSNTNFAKINIVDPTKVSTSLVIMNFLEENKLQITDQSAISLYTALVDDSNFFKLDRVDKKTFLKASKLVELGAKPHKIADYLTNRNSLAKIRLTQVYLDKLTLENRATIAISKITLKDFEKTGAKKSDGEELVNIGLSLATVKLSIYMYEVDHENIKVSLRSKSDIIDCSKIALKYNGGGHKKAAGFTANVKEIDGIILNIIKIEGDL